MSVKNSSRILSTILQNGNNQESHTIMYLKNFGNLSGGIVTRKITTPSRSVRTIGGEVGSIKSINGGIGSVRSFRRGIPVSG